MLNFALLKHRWSSVTLILACMLGILVMSSCGTPHKTYSYGHFTQVLSASALHTGTGDDVFTFHPGDQFLLKWAPSPVQETTSSSPVTITAELKGPFATLTAIQLAESDPNGDVSGPVAAGMKPIQTNSWTDKTYQYDFQLNRTLAAGYYVLLQTVTTGKNSNTFRSEIKILA
jgi:hypothetical protein